MENKTYDKQYKISWDWLTAAGMYLQYKITNVCEPSKIRSNVF